MNPAIIAKVVQFAGPILSIFGGGKSSGYIKKNINIIVIILLVFIVYYQNSSSSRWMLGLSTIPAMREDIRELNEDVAELQTKLMASEDSLSAAVLANEELVKINAQQAIAINNFTIANEELDRELTILDQEIEDFFANNQLKINTILNAPTPTTCEASMVFLRKSIGVLMEK